MSGHRIVYFVFCYMCFLHACISKTLNDSRQKRYTEDDICHESQTTVKKVDVCPENNETLNKRSIEKNCSRYQTCSEHHLVYHCIMNGGGLVEVCAPRSLITGRVCPYYDNALGRVIEDTRKRCTKCPFQYQSDEYLKNSECVPASVTNEDSNGQSYSINASTNKGIPFVECLRKNYSSIYLKVLCRISEYGLKNESVASGENMRTRDREKNTDQNDTYTTVLLVVISICGFFVFGIYLTCSWFFRKNLNTCCLKHEDG